MSSGIEALLTKAKESLAAAHVLIKDGYYDFAASRAYYAMFYVASAVLADLGQSYSSHSAVIKRNTSAQDTIRVPFTHTF